MNSAWPLISAGLLMGAGGSLHCLTMCSGLQRMTLRGIPIVTVRTTAASSTHAGTTPSSNMAHAAATTAAGAGGAGAGAGAGARAGATGTVSQASPAPGFQLPDGRWWRFQAK